VAATGFTATASAVWAGGGPVDGAWFFYPAPVYPYPDPYIPPSAVAEAPPPQPSPQYWYYCPSANGYYPYVMSCPEGWTAVAPRPAP
jgi:hypothetical protein